MINQNGFVLVTVLLLLTVITMVVMRVVESSVLESKMSNYLAQKTIAFYKAETELTKAEDDILQGKTGKYRNIQHECGVEFYLATGSSEFHGAAVALQSTVAVVDKSKHCNPPPQEISGHLAWAFGGND